MHIIGIDLGGTKITGALFSFEGEIMLRKHNYLEKKEGKEVADLVINMIKEFLSMGLSIKSIGICVPGIVNQNTGRIWAPNIPGWDQYPLLGEIKANLPQDENIAVEIASDRTCYILGEKWKGQAKDVNNAIYFSVGTGIGLGILLDGKIVHGHGDIVGAIGWMALQTPYDDLYKDCGCFETYASGNGIVNHAKYLINSSSEKYEKSLLHQFQVDNITCNDVFHAYSMGDCLAQDVIIKAIEFWGMAAANVISLFNPALIIWGGGVFGPAVQFMNKIELEARKWAQPIAMEQVRFVPSSVNNGAGLIGAGYLALTTYQLADEKL
jgi:glucokinase